MKRLKAALVQAELRWQDPQANRAHLSELMDRSPGADLYVLPETFTTGFLGDAGRGAEEFDGPTLAWMRTESRRRSAAVAGSVALTDADGLRRNRMVFMPPDGDPGWYDKRHLFSFGGEDERYTAGAAHTVVSWRGWRIDLQICYDLRFPVWCRNDRDFDLQLFVANWPSPRVEAWRLLLQARAVENQAFVIGVNCCGRLGNGNAYSGRSVALDGAGERLLELGSQETVDTVTLDREALQSLRKKLPFLQDRDQFRLEN
ncbi:nitrilase-related carbon-nitrogen hydrolase [Wenzhouxiangella limi]|uniref:Omega-amidase YafV n=1 Tax=Wenzhouxiangella limi TaxID=2707351 RepID=A0A845V2R1_9GAMM|nr:nitrilase-related carbon-nitrogen hydrolase [Wenzhouxiangella limi]NDY96994.1 amidohydrolase [Wenzhouxiangella limi]